MGEADDTLSPVPTPATGLAQLRSFGDVVALAGQRRDAKLKIHLEENVSLVKFDAVAGSIDLFLLPALRRNWPTTCARSSTSGPGGAGWSFCRR